MDSNSSSSPSSSCASLDIEAGFSSCPPPPPPAPTRAPHAGGERNTRRSPGARFFFVDDCCDEPRHFLDSCFLCRRPLAGNRDIFMYRGDTPFCSMECRQEQIEMDEASEKKMKISRQSSSEKQSPSTSSSPKSENIHLRADTAVAAG